MLLDPSAHSRQYDTSKARLQRNPLRLHASGTSFSLSFSHFFFEIFAEIAKSWTIIELSTFE
jgi:hypothetical protein